jgi:hypothetical protein
MANNLANPNCDENIKNKYNCEICDYNTCNKKDYTKHLFTLKHQKKSQMLTKMLIKIPKSPKNPKEEKKFICDCGNTYKHLSSLCKHKKKCNYTKTCENNSLTDTVLSSDIKLLSGIMYEIVKSNQELQKQILDVCKNSQITNNNTVNNTMTNCHNKTFNLQVFLNETCKNAMNLSEFIENMTVELPDLENMGKLGYVEGVSNIIIKNLKALEITQRPIHCTDEKRETVMIKENNVWFKEGDDRENLRKIVSTVISKNLILLAEYQEKYPDCNTYDSHRSDEYTKIIMETATNQAEKKKEKIFRLIAREVVIDKTIL